MLLIGQLCPSPQDLRGNTVTFPVKSALTFSLQQPLQFTQRDSSLHHPVFTCSLFTSTSLSLVSMITWFYTNRDKEHPVIEKTWESQRGAAKCHRAPSSNLCARRVPALIRKQQKTQSGSSRGKLFKRLQRKITAKELQKNYKMTTRKRQRTT